MYDFLSGEIDSRTPGRVTLCVGGIGYRFLVPLSTWEALPSVGTVRLFAHLRQTDEGPRLYGFATIIERDLFERLIAVSGIGPGTALSVLSGIGVAEFAGAVRAGDAERLTRIRRVGRKTADRIVLEMKEDVDDLLATCAADGRTTPTALLPAVVAEEDAVRALVALGYVPKDARRAVERARGALGQSAALEALVRAALAG